MPDERLRLEPSEAEIERWAERERQRRRSWLSGPTAEERAAWRLRERQRRLARLAAEPASEASDRAPSAQHSLREAQLAAEGAVSLLQKAMVADSRAGLVRRWSRRGLELLVRAGREWEEECDRPSREAAGRAPSECVAAAAPRRAAPRLAAARAAAKAGVCLLEVFPVLPSRPLDRVAPRPVVARLRYRTSHGDAESELYRPAGAGPHPGVVVCLGVVPFGVEHPLVPRLGEALARAGLATLLYWSPAMRDLRLDPADVEDIASAYEALVAQPDVDSARSGLLGTCVGGAFALMAAASLRIRDGVAFVVACAPYASLWALAQDIASASRWRDGRREPWAVDPLTRTVYVHTLTALLEPGEARRLRSACADRHGTPDVTGVSEAGRAVVPLLTALDPEAAEWALRRLPAALQARLTAMSPMAYLRDLRSPLVVLLHDREDPVIPVGESRRLREALAARGGVRYAEVAGFRHLDPTQGTPSPVALTRELVRVARAIYPLFQLFQRDAAPEPQAAQASDRAPDERPRPSLAHRGAG